jgi:hypothetical protein
MAREPHTEPTLARA